MRIFNFIVTKIQHLIYSFPWSKIIVIEKTPTSATSTSVLSGVMNSAVSKHCQQGCISYVRACTQWTISHTDLWELLDPHPRLELHILYVQVLGVGRGAVGELHLHRHHVGVRAERLPAETVLHRQTLTRDPVKQLVALQRAGGSNGL